MNMKTVMSQIALIAVTLSLLTQPANARPPEFQTFHVDRTIIDTQLCGFPIEVHDEGDVRVAFHFDKAGNIEWVNVTTSNYRIALTNPANGISLWTPSPEHIVETAYDTTNHPNVVRFRRIPKAQAPNPIKTGLVLRFVLPGVGLLTLDAGRVVFNNNGDVTIAGPHMFLEGDVEALCAALSGE